MKLWIWSVMRFVHVYLTLIAIFSVSRIFPITDFSMNYELFSWFSKLASAPADSNIKNKKNIQPISYSIVQNMQLCHKNLCSKLQVCIFNGFWDIVVEKSVVGKIRETEKIAIKVKKPYAKCITGGTLKIHSLSTKKDILDAV